MNKKQSLKLQDRLALVTGANRGIGFEIARALARGGCDVVITGRDENALARARQRIEKLGVCVIAQTCDVRNPDSIDYLFAVIRALRRPLDFLINNAGIGHPSRPVEKLAYPVWTDVIATNLTGMFLVTQAALAVMKRESTIVNNLSIAASAYFRAPQLTTLRSMARWALPTRCGRNCGRRESA